MFGNPDPEHVIEEKVEQFYNSMMAAAQAHIATAFDHEDPEMMKTAQLKTAMKKARAAIMAADAAAGAAKEVLSGIEEQQAKDLRKYAANMLTVIEGEDIRRRKAAKRAAPARRRQAARVAGRRARW